MKARASVFKDLKRIVDEHLAKSPISSIGPRAIRFKSAFLILGWIATYSLLLLLGPSYGIVAILCLLTLLFFTCGLEFCIMHDASHLALSDKKWVNKLFLNMTLAVLGGCSVSWHQEHVVRHHGSTNVLGADPDVYASHVLRLHPEDSWHWWHAWQHYYAIPLFSFMWVHWMFLDFTNAFFNSYNLSKEKNRMFWVLIFVGIVPHVLLSIVIPYLVFQDMWLVGISYVIFFMALSFIMAMTFVLAHVSEENQYFLEEDIKEKDWAVHQIETTCDFAVDNKFLVWILGGLNFQVEHHIFPTVCHLHYPEIQKIVKKYCHENSIPYHEEKTVWGAFVRHFNHLKAMSTPPQKELCAEEAIN